jgi:hypothetical protein
MFANSCAYFAGEDAKHDILIFLAQVGSRGSFVFVTFVLALFTYLLVYL